MDLPVDNNNIALFNAARSVVLENGNKAKFWSSRWLDGQAPATLYLALFKHSKRENKTVSDALADDKWISDVDYSMTEWVVEEFISLWTCLQESLSSRHMRMRSPGSTQLMANTRQDRHIKYNSLEWPHP